MKYIILTIGILVISLSGTVGVLSEGDQAAATDTDKEVKAMIRALRGDAVQPRLRAKVTLIRMGDKAGSALLQALKNTAPGESYDLIEILARIRYKAAAGDIEKIWKETESDQVKLMASQALCRFDYNYNRYQSFILSRTGTGSVKARLEAMQMLGYIGDKRVVEPLEKIFYNEDMPDQVRQAAVWDLGHTPVKESAKALVNMVDDSGVDWFYKEIIIAAIRTLSTNKEMTLIVSELLEKTQNIPGRPGRKK
ncbi:MAG: HEAT repeat domain-containing protein [Candidatus Auribacterota bacterium]|nr:HEAT repeat domain-containing protein [Candidatus Auribacterota bacterium]